MLSSRTGVHGQLVAKRVEEASEAGTESVHRRVTFHALTILQKRKTVTQMPALQTVRNVTPVRMNFAVKLCRVVGPVIIDMMFFFSVMRCYYCKGKKNSDCTKTETCKNDELVINMATEKLIVKQF